MITEPSIKVIEHGKFVLIENHSKDPVVGRMRLDAELIPELIHELVKTEAARKTSGTYPLLVYVSSDEDRQNLIEALETSNVVRMLRTKR